MFLLSFEEMFRFSSFSEKHGGESEKNERKRAKGTRHEKRQTVEHRSRASPPQRSKAAERAAASARPDGPSEKSCRNKCRRVERMLRAKRTNSPADCSWSAKCWLTFELLRAEVKHCIRKTRVIQCLQLFQKISLNNTSNCASIRHSKD